MLLTTLKTVRDRGTVVDTGGVYEGVVSMHSRVPDRDLGYGESERTATSPLAGKLSVLARPGIALFGARMGQVVEFTAPAGPRRLKFEKVLNQLEGAGNSRL